MITDKCPQCKKGKMVDGSCTDCWYTPKGKDLNLLVEEAEYIPSAFNNPFFSRELFNSDSDIPMIDPHEHGNR